MVYLASASLVVPTRPDYGHIPFFLKVVTTSMFSADTPIGRVLMHNNDGANSPCGLENLPAGVSWTAPEAGPVAISGGMWQVVDFNRTEEWTLSLNGVAISGGLLSYSPLITSVSPFDLSSGTGGAAVLHQTVAIGDVIALYFTRPDGQPYGHTMGVDLTISVVPEPTTVELIVLVRLIRIDLSAQSMSESAK